MWWCRISNTVRCDYCKSREWWTEFYWSIQDHLIFIHNGSVLHVYCRLKYAGLAGASYPSHTHTVARGVGRSAGGRTQWVNSWLCGWDLTSNTLYLQKRILTLTTQDYNIPFLYCEIQKSLDEGVKSIARFGEWLAERRCWKLDVALNVTRLCTWYRLVPDLFRILYRAHCLKSLK